MKIFNQIIIILFVVTSLFIMKEDVLSVFNTISSHFNKDSIDNPTLKLIEKEDILPIQVDTPGALRVIDKVLFINNKTELSKNNIILLTNKYRKEDSDLGSLKENPRLNLSAEKKIEDMFTNQYFEHISKDGLGVGDLGEKAGYEYILIGENLAMGNFKDDRSLVDAWIASEGHRENIINTKYTEIGVAVGKGKFEGKEIWMAVQHFGTPKDVCPEIDQVLYGTININQVKLKEIESELVLRLNMINKGVVYDGNSRSQQINIYNTLINFYNELIKNTKEKIINYNNGVRLFNECLLDINKSRDSSA